MKVICDWCKKEKKGQEAEAMKIHNIRCWDCYQEELKKIEEKARAGKWKRCHCGGEVIDDPKDKHAVNCTRCAWRGFKILWVKE